MADEAVDAADKVLTIALRALDYLPPYDVTFSDFLRALVTADRELFPTDAAGIRTEFIDAFRRRGIYPEGVISLAEDALIWPAPSADRIQAGYSGAVTLSREVCAEILSQDALSLDRWTHRADDELGDLGLSAVIRHGQAVDPRDAHARSPRAPGGARARAGHLPGRGIPVALPL